VSAKDIALGLTLALIGCDKGAKVGPAPDKATASGATSAPSAAASTSAQPPAGSASAKQGGHASCAPGKCAPGKCGGN
jgi:hypothetical protein